MQNPENAVYGQGVPRTHHRGQEGQHERILGVLAQGKIGDGEGGQVESSD